MVQTQPSTASADDVIYTIVEEIAGLEDVDPLTLTPPLFEVIDSDALEQLFAAASTGARTDVQVTFSYNGYEITVCDDGDVSVEE